MGNDASKKPKKRSNNNSNISINDGSSDIFQDDSSEFQNVSHPSSPENIPGATKKIEDDIMSYSGILVEKPGVMTENEKDSSNSSAFAAVVSKSAKEATPVAPNRRRIIKATPPSAKSSNATASSSSSSSSGGKNGGEVDDENTSHKQHLPAVLSPKASTELLEDSMEQARNKRLEALAREQKSKRDKLLEERRKMASSDDPNQKKKETSQPNPFSKFLRAFSVEPVFPHHKRAYEEGEIDREEAAASAAAAAAEGSADNTLSSSGRNSPSGLVNKRFKLDDKAADKSTAARDTSFSASWWSTMSESLPEWAPMVTAAAAMATVAVVVALKLNTGSKKS